LLQIYFYDVTHIIVPNGKFTLLLLI
jgi:hypothetical protein